ncbi:MAG: hypothetical protein R2769_05525 [Saprospiraceae bacterium]
MDAAVRRFMKDMKMYKGQTFFFANLPTEGAGAVEVYLSNMSVMIKNC